MYTFNLDISQRQMSESRHTVQQASQGQNSMSTKKLYLLLFALITAAIVAACSSNTTPTTTSGFTPEIEPLPAQLSTYEPMTIPADNPMTAEKVALGKQLFFDERLSIDNSKSCYSCHVCEHGLTDGLPKAIGALNKQLPRSSPTLWNIGYHKEFYWDGRSPSLEKQAMAAWTGGNMGVGDKVDEVVGRINALQGYREQFQKVFQSEATADNMMKAIAAYERTIISGNTAWDRYQAGDASAISESAFRGSNIFRTIKCNQCHDGVLFTDQQYHNIGIGMDQEKPDVGRFVATKRPEDTGAFKTPTLRDIAKSAPYFHDGSAKTLEEAVDIMLAGGKPNQYLDKKNLQPQRVLPEQREDLLNFLRSLSVDCNLKKPPLPQK
jgi:cytochrome c peroxidase